MFEKLKTKAKEATIASVKNMIVARLRTEAKQKAPEVYGNILSMKLFLSDVKPSIMRNVFENYEGDSAVEERMKESVVGMIPKDINREDIDFVIIDMDFKTNEVLININLKNKEIKNYKF